MLTAESVTAKVFVEFLRRLITGAKQAVFLIVDGHPSHRPSAVRQFLRINEGRIRLIYLPPYSPDLNPDEQVWREVKPHGSGRRAVASKRKLKQHRTPLRKQRNVPGNPNKPPGPPT